MSSSGSTVTTISTSAVQNLVDKLKLERNRSSTRKNYHCIWKLFNEFFIKLDAKPKTWEERLILFVGYLVGENKRSATVKSYISAIKLVLLEDGITLNADKYLLASLTRACKYKNNKATTRLPIQKNLLWLLISELESHFGNMGQLYLEKLYKAIFVTAYYGMFRIGEIMSGSHPVLVNDVKISENKNKFLFILRTSKTHWKDNKPQKIKLTNTPAEKISTSTLTKVCPYITLNDYVDIKPTGISYSEPFFVFADRSPVRPHHFRKTLKLILSSSGCDPGNYSCHSFRIGEALIY